jgi:hypothetical protein
VSHSELHECGPLLVGDAPFPPGMQRLRAQTEMRPDEVDADRLHEIVVGVPVFAHGAARYQRAVYISSPQSFMGGKHLFRHIVGMASDTAFGERLEAAIKDAGFKNPRRFAIDAMNWPDSSGPQRVQNYIKGRIPDDDTLNLMAGKLGVSPVALLGYDPNAADAEIRDILRYLLELAGIGPGQADTIASAAFEARQLLRGLPEEGPPDIRARIAAHAAWRQRRSPTLGKQSDSA